MNKNLYRIIFSKARNMFIAVGENSKSQTKSAGESTKTSTSAETQDHTTLHQHWVVKSLVASISLWMPLAPVYAQIQADSSANAANRPVIGVGKNTQGQNVPVVNIQTPVNGVSHNIYKQMDVLNNGVVLNNSRTGAGSAIVGSVGANPFLAKGEARLILNEINSTAATRFEGNLEVAGQRADVIIANPAGINIKGGGFINANKAIFTTGKPQLNADGSLQQFVVDQGKVTVNANAGSNLGLGGNNNNADYVDIYARALELNAQLHANQDLNVITGANTILASLENIESKTSTAPAPTLAVDIKSLGGMYANNIYLMGNEKGLGVSNAGTLQASNNLIVTSAGQIVHSGTITSTDKKNGLVSVATTGIGAAADIAVSGTINSYGLINVDSGNDLKLTAKDITLNYDATTKNSAALIVNAKGNLNLASGTNISNLSTDGDLYIDAKNINLAANSKVLSNRGSATMNAGESLISNNTANLIAAKDLNLTANKDLKLLGSALQASTGSINVQSTAADAQLIQVDGGTLYAGKDFNVYGTGDVSLKNLSFNLVNNATRLKDINVYSGKNLSWDNKAKQLPKISGKVQLEAKQGLELSGTAIHAANGIVTQSDTLNLNSAIKSDQGIDLTTHKAMNLAQGTALTATKDVNLASLQGNIQAQSLKVNSSQGRASIIANENVNLNSVQATVAAPHADRDEKITDKTVIHADQGIVIASSEKGSVTVNSADLSSAKGDLQILGQNGVTLNSNTDAVVSGDNARDTLLTNQLKAKSVSIGTKKGKIDIQNTAMESTVDQLHLNSEAGMLTVNNSTLRSKGNTEIYAKDILTLKNVTANADQHLAVNSKRTIYLNADYTPATVWDPTAKVALTSKGVLSLTATGNQVMQNATLTGGAVLLETTNLYVKPGLVFNATGSDLLKNDAKLNSLNGDLSIQTTGTTGLIIDPKIMNLSAIGDIELVAKNGVLKLAGYGGTQGNGSEQVVKINAAMGGITLQGNDVTLQGADLTARKNIDIVATAGDVVVDGVKNTLTNRMSKSESSIERKAYNQNILNEAEKLKSTQITKDYDALRNLHMSLFPPFTDANDSTKLKEFEVALNVFLAKYPALKVSPLWPGRPYYFQPYTTIPDPIGVTIGRIVPAGIYDNFEKVHSDSELNIFRNEVAYLNGNFNGFEHQGTNLKSSSGNINIAAKGGISISGSDIEATAGGVSMNAEKALAGVSYQPIATNHDGKLLAEKPASILIDGFTDFYDKGKETDTNYSLRSFVKPTEIKAQNDIQVRSLGTTINDNVVIQAVDIQSTTGSLKLESGNDMLFDVAIEESYDKSTKTSTKRSWYGKKKVKTTTTTNAVAANAPVNLTAAKDIILQSDNDTKIFSTGFDAGGDITIKAGGHLEFLAIKDVEDYNSTSKSRSSIFGIKYNDKNTTTTRNQISHLPSTLSASSINTKSGLNTVLASTEFKYLKDAEIKAGGEIILLAMKDVYQKTYKAESNSVVWQSMQDKGSITETAKLPSFNGPVSPTFKAAGGISVQIPISEKDQNKVVLRDEILKLANQPGNAYLKEFVNRKDVDWNTVILAQKDWDYKSQGLTGAGAAIIAIVVAMVTAGAGAAVVGALGGSAATLGGSAIVMTQAAVTSLASQASISLVNNGGDIGKTLKDLGSKDSVRNLATAVVTAGIMDKVGASLNIKLNDMPKLEHFTNNFIQGVGSTIISSSVQGESLSDILDEALIAGISSSLQGEFALKIKKLEDVNYVLHKIAHAAAGCAIGALQKSCEAGAIGAAVGEVVAGELNDGTKTLTNFEKEQIINQSKLIAGVVAAYAGYDVNIAINSADTAVRNNNTHEAVVMAELDALWIDSGYDKEKYFEGVEKIAERDGIALGILTSWMTLGTGSSIFSAFVTPSWKELPKFRQNYVNDYMTQFGKGEEGAIKLLAHIQKNGIPKDIDRKAFSAYQKQILNVGGNKAKTSSSKVFQTRVEILKNILGGK